MDCFEYKIKSFLFTQTELIWKQDKKLSSLIKKAVVHSEGGKQQVSLEKLFEMALQSDLLQSVVDILLKPKWTFRYGLYYASQILQFPFRWRIRRVPVDVLSNSDIKKIRTDFFLLNKELMTSLNGWLSGLGLIAKTMMAENAPTTAEPGTTSALTRNMTAPSMNN